MTLAGGIIPFGEPHAKEAARLFYAVGRSRRFKFDSLIAATAILANAELATVNAADFQSFVPHGLKLRDLS